MKIFRSVLSIFLIFSLILTIFIFNISSFSRTDNMEKTLKKSDLLTEVKKIKNSGKVGNQSSMTAVINDVYATAEEYGIDSKLVDTVIDSDAMKEALGYAAGNVTDYVINGKETPILTKDDLYNVAENNIDDWIKQSGISVTDNQKKKILEGSKEFIPIVVRNLPSSSDIASGYKSQVEVVQFLFSNTVKVGLVIIDVLLILLIIILGRKQFKWLFDFGMVFGICGIALSVLAIILPDLILMVPNSADISLITTTFTDYLFKPVLIIGFVFIILSILLFIIYKTILNKKLRVES